MATKSKKPFKPTGGLCCTVTSTNYFIKMKQYGKINVSFDRLFYFIINFILHINLKLIYTRRKYSSTFVCKINQNL